MIAAPLLLIGHGVAGIVSVGLITAYEVGQAAFKADRRVSEIVSSVAAVLLPLTAAVGTIMIWKIVGASGAGRTLWLLERKQTGLIMMLRDQNRLLDVGSVVACVLLVPLGYWWGARLKGGAAAAVLFAAALFVATPSLISGSDQIDTRLAPLIPILAFALTDWSGVSEARRHSVLIAGFALLAFRWGVTTASFVEYGQRYQRELAALQHVRPGARILNLAKVSCSRVAWRSERLEHLASLATPLRAAWVNSHWRVEGLQLLQIRYDASANYASDPSQLIWPERCIDMAMPFGERQRHALAESIPALPLDRADFLWLLGQKLPAGKRDPRLQPVWADDISELYAIRHPG